MNDEPLLDLDDIQGNILPGFKKDSQHYVFLRIVDVPRSKSWLSKIAPRLSSAREVREAHAMWKGLRLRHGRDPDNLDFLFINCAISAEGLRKLGIDDLDEFGDAAFKLGMERRAGLIGDPRVGSSKAGAPDTWLFGSDRKRPDVLIIIASDDLAWAIKAEKELIASARANGFQLIHVDRGRVRPGALAGHEHFGFKDGISQPAVRGRVSDAAHDYLEPRSWPADAEFDRYRTRYASPGRPLVWPGHFLFGYPRQLRDRPEELWANSSPAAPAWAKNGSFVVYRRLLQDVAAFQRFISSASEELQNAGFATLSRERLGALLMGRWPSGWPVMRDSLMDRGDHRIGENHFVYSEATTVSLPDDLYPLNPADPNGMVCPFAAHTRKIQPRDDSTDLGPMERTFHKLLLRRGITFGSELDESPEAPRGLLFVSYQTSIVDQFEFLMNDWVNDPDKPHSGSGIDPIIGNARDSNSKFSLYDGQVKHTLAVPGGWVTASGGEYMFSPGIAFFSNLSG
jgi:Dyp-type peroxidase family